jgi:3-oxoacyl-[acyl-carrier protein] reductase
LTELCVVTGASRGIGRATALALGRRGSRLALMGRPSPQLDETLQILQKLAVEARAFTCDLGETEAIAAAATSVVREWGAPRAVINNAGMLVRGPLVHETAVEDWNRTLAVNLTGPFLLCRALLPAMLESGRGRFVHVSSISGTIGSPRAAAYAASKWGLIGLSKSLAEELRGTGLQSVALLPGSVDTAMLEQTPFEPAMTPEDVANLIVYYALDAPDAVQGAAVELFG